MRSRISLTLKGRPMIFVMEMASTRYLARTSKAELAGVEFRDEHLVETLEQLAEIRWHRIEVAQVGAADIVAFEAQRFDGGSDGAVSAAPAED